MAEQHFVETEQDLDRITELAIDTLWAEEPESRPPTESYSTYVKVFDHEHWEAVVIPIAPVGQQPEFIMFVDDTGAVISAKIGLRELVVKLRNIDGGRRGLRIVGGAALALRYFDRESTVDIDAHPIGDLAQVLDAGREIAHEHGWPDDWLNNLAAGFVPEYGARRIVWETLCDDGEVVIHVASRAQTFTPCAGGTGRGRRTGASARSRRAVRSRRA